MTQPMPPNPNLPPEQLPDVSPLADAHQAALADLQAEWQGLSDKQKQQLVDAVYTAVAAGTVADLLTLPLDITGATAALTAAMAAIAAAAAHLLVAEAADQGVHVPAVHVPAAVFEPTAQVVAGTLGDELRITAARAALQYGPDATPTDVADAARAALDARSGASETKQLGGALHGAMNTGRIASLRRAPTGAIYAQEMNDSRVCGPCREVNGRWLGNIPDDLPQILAMYPDGAYGGYISCLGGINCRGTITGVWRPDQVEATNRRRMLGEFDPAEPRDPETGEWIGEELGHVAHKLVDSTRGGGHHVAAYDDYDGDYTRDGHPGRIVAVAMEKGGRAPWKDEDALDDSLVLDRRDIPTTVGDMESVAATARDFHPTPEQIEQADETGPILVHAGETEDRRIAAYFDVNGDRMGFENTPFIAIQSQTLSSLRELHALYPNLYRSPEDWTDDILGAPSDVLVVDARKVPGLADAIRRMADTTAVATANRRRLRNFDPDEPRDPDGKWSEVGEHIEKAVKHLTAEDFTTDTEKTEEQVETGAVHRVAQRWNVSEDDLRELGEAEHLTEHLDSLGSHEERKESLARYYIHNWGGSSGGPAPIAAITHVLDERHIPYQLSPHEQGPQRWIASRPGLARATASFGDAMYGATQEWFKERGITHVHALRATRSEERDAGRPFTSWTGHRGGLRQDGDRIVREADIPVDRIFSIPPTGFGTLWETELVVLPLDEVKNRAAVRIFAKGGQHRDHHEKPDYTAADLGVPELHSTEVDPQDVNVDRQHYQRDLDPDEVDRFRAHPKRLAKRWGLLARRPDGSLWVVNGQHHTQAAVDEGIRQMRYRVFDSTGPAQEGRVYAAYQRWHDGWHAARPDEPRNEVRVEFNPDQPRDPDGKWSSLGAHIAHEIHKLGGGELHVQAHHADTPPGHVTIRHGDRHVTLNEREQRDLLQALRGSGDPDYGSRIRPGRTARPEHDVLYRVSHGAHDEEGSATDHQLSIAGPGDDFDTIDQAPAVSLSNREAERLTNSIVRVAEARRVDTSNGPLDMFVTPDEKIGLRMKDEAGQPTEVTFGQSDWNKIAGGLNVLWEGYDETGEFNNDPEAEVNEITVKTSAGPVSMRWRGGRDPRGGPVPDSSLLMVPDYPAGWSVAVDGQHMDDFFGPFGFLESAAGFHQ